jgi:hypothetical protein
VNLESTNIVKATNGPQTRCKRGHPRRKDYTPQKGCRDCKTEWEKRKRASLGKARKTKLNPTSVLVIRARAANGEKLEPIAMEYNVNPSTIERCVRGQTWANVK